MKKVFIVESDAQLDVETTWISINHLFIQQTIAGQLLSFQVKARLWESRRIQSGLALKEPIVWCPRRGLHITDNYNTQG